MASTGTIVGLDLTGEKELIKALKELEGSINRRVIKKAANKSMKPVVKAAKEKLRGIDRTGQLRKSIGSRQKKFSSGVVWTGVGPRKGFKIMATVTRKGIRGKLGRTGVGSLFFGGEEEVVAVNPVNYAHLVEFGFKHYISGKTIPARPFLRPALDNNRGKVQSILVHELKVNIAKEVVKARQKAGGPR